MATTDGDAGPGAVPAASEKSGKAATGRVSAGLTGRTSDSAESGTAVQGGIVEKTTFGNDTGNKGADLNLGESAAGGLGLHGDQEARTRGGVTGSSGGAMGSISPGAVPPRSWETGERGGPGSGMGGGLGGPSGSGSAMARASGAQGDEAGSGLVHSVVVPDTADEDAASPELQDGSPTAATGGSAIDRVNTGSGGDVGGSVGGRG